MLSKCGAEKTLENPLDSKEVKPVNPKWKSTLNIHWKYWCWSWSSNTLATWWELTHWKIPWCWERLRARGEGGTKDEMVGWHHWLCGHEVEQIPGDSGGQRSLECYNLWGHKELNTTEWLNKNKGNQSDFLKHKVTLISPHKSFWDKVLNTLA